MEFNEASAFTRYLPSIWTMKDTGRFSKSWHASQKRGI
jgi:hypothetical protein